MKNSLSLLLLFALAWIPLHASHEMGAQITYSCLSACTTRVHFKGYRDCTGINSISNTINWVSPPGCTPPPQIGTVSNVATVEVTPVCPGAPTGCTTPGAPVNGVEEMSSYRDYDICAGSPCVYTLQWTDCCRNPAITSLSNASSQSITLRDVRLNTALGTCNNSPVYTNYPLFYACQGQDYDVHQGAVDPDHDSLAYQMSSCYQTMSTQTIYASGFSGTAPLGPSWNVTLDGSTGMLHLDANPGNAVVGVICITVQEYRNGQMIGQTQRDIQITTINCGTNSNPVIGALTNVSTGATSQPNYHVWCNAGTPLCFDVPTTDADAGQTLKLTWTNPDNTSATFSDASNGSIFNTITGTGANPPVGRLCWANPTYGTYHFKVRVEDSNCPVYGHSERFIFVHVNPCNQGTNVTLTPMGCPTMAFSASSCLMGNVSYLWTGSGGFASNSPTPIYTYPSTGPQTYQLIVTNGFTSDTVNGSFNITPGAPVYQPCITGGLNLSICGNLLSTTLDAGVGSLYQWSNGSNSQQITISIAASYSVTVSEANGCEHYDIATVNSIPPDIDGYVTTSTSAPLANEKVMLIQHDTTQQALWAVDSATTDNNGYYFFCNVVDTTVFLKAIPSASNYPNEMPTYADTTLYWNNAITFMGVLQAPFSHNFSTLFGSNPGGPGFIGGLISQGANKMSAVGDPIAGLRIALIDHATRDIISTTTTNAAGYFYFAGIPVASYDIVPDRPLVSTTNVPLVTLTAQQPVRDSLNFQLHHYWLELVNSTVGTAAPLPGLSFNASPNPFTKTTRISLNLPADADVAMDVYDVVGKCVAHLADGSRGAGRYNFSVGDGLGAGIYFVRLQVNGHEQVIKLLKN